MDGTVEIRIGGPRGRELYIMFRTVSIPNTSTRYDSLPISLNRQSERVDVIAFQEQKTGIQENPPLVALHTTCLVRVLLNVAKVWYFIWSFPTTRPKASL